MLVSSFSLHQLLNLSINPSEDASLKRPCDLFLMWEIHLRHESLHPLICLQVRCSDTNIRFCIMVLKADPWREEWDDECPEICDLSSPPTPRPSVICFYKTLNSTGSFIKGEMQCWTRWEASSNRTPIDCHLWKLKTGYGRRVVSGQSVFFWEDGQSQLLGSQVALTHSHPILNMTSIVRDIGKEPGE